MKISIISPVWIEGVARDIGDTVEVPDLLGTELVGNGRAVTVVDPAPAPADAPAADVPAANP